MNMMMLFIYTLKQIEELKNFKDTSQSHIIQKIGIIRLNRLLYIIIQISLVKKGNTVEAFYEAYVENGEVHLKKKKEEAYGDTEFLHQK